MVFAVLQRPACNPPTTRLWYLQYFSDPPATRLRPASGICSTSATRLQPTYDPPLVFAAHAMLNVCCLCFGVCVAMRSFLARHTRCMFFPSACSCKCVHRCRSPVVVKVAEATQSTPQRLEVPTPSPTALKNALAILCGMGFLQIFKH